MNFKQAIEEMKKGKKVRRKGWGDTWFIINNYGTLLRCIPSFYNKNQADTNIDPLSLANVENIFAEDWEVIEDKKQWWEPKNKDLYWYISNDGEIHSWNFNKKFNTSSLNFGNCFQTKKQAKFMVEKLKVIHELEKFAYENNVGKTKWSTYDLNKYTIIFNHKSHKLEIDVWTISQDNPFNVFFTSKELAKKAIETIGEDRIKKYYFGVEDE